MNLSAIGEPFITLNKVDSTNNYAMARVNESLVSEGTTWFAWDQTKGKGQRDKSWNTTPGSSICLSIVFQPLTIQPTDQFIFSALIALGVCDLVQAYAGRETRIKWSNDIYFNDKKAGGILIENVIRGNTWNYAIAGIGLNINEKQFPASLPNPISLSQITGREYDVLDLAHELCHCIGQRYATLRPERYQEILAEYTSRLYCLDLPTRFRQGETVFEGFIRGVENDGRLIIQKENSSQLMQVGFGEVNFVLPEEK